MEFQFAQDRARLWIKDADEVVVAQNEEPVRVQRQP